MQTRGTAAAAAAPAVVVKSSAKAPSLDNLRDWAIFKHNWTRYVREVTEEARREKPWSRVGLDVTDGLMKVHPHTNEDD